MKNSFLNLLYKDLIKLIKLKKFILKPFFKKKYISLIYIEHEITSTDVVKITRYVRYFYRNLFLRNLLTNLPIFFKKTNKFYFNFLARFFIYNYIKLDF